MAIAGFVIRQPKAAGKANRRGRQRRRGLVADGGYDVPAAAQVFLDEGETKAATCAEDEGGTCVCNVHG